MSPVKAAARPSDKPVCRRLFTLAILLAGVAFDGGVLGQEDAGAGDAGTTSSRDWSYPPRGPDRGRGDRPGGQWWESGPWHASAGVGAGWFGGDDLSDSAAFAAQLRVGCDLSDEAYFVGSYLFASPETDGGAGDAADESHDLHVLTLGVGLRADVTDGVRLFVEPRAGALFGSGVDAAPVGALTGGVDFFVAEGISIRLELTGLITDAEIDTGDAGSANLDSGVIGSFGISFEF